MHCLLPTAKLEGVLRVGQAAQTLTNVTNALASNTAAFASFYNTTTFNVRFVVSCCDVEECIRCCPVALAHVMDMNRCCTLASRLTVPFLHVDSKID